MMRRYWFRYQEAIILILWDFSRSLTFGFHNFSFNVRIWISCLPLFYAHTKNTSCETWNVIRHGNLPQFLSLKYISGVVIGPEKSTCLYIEQLDCIVWSSRGSFILSDKQESWMLAFWNHFSSFCVRNGYSEKANSLVFQEPAVL